MRADRLQVRKALQASRGIAILIVVIFHSDRTLIQIQQYVPFTGVTDALRFIPMPLFFLSVGMSLAQAFERNHAASHLTRRAVHYGYLFVIWTAVDLTIATLGSSRAVTPSQLIKAFVHPDGTLWFLYALTAQLFLLGAISSFSKYAQLMISFMLVCVSSFAHSPLMVGMTGYMLFLVVGARFTPVLQTVISKGRLWAFYSCVVAYTIFSIISNQSQFMLKAIISIPASILGIIVISMSFKIFNRYFPVSVFCYIGKSSFEIYILHNYFVILFVQALSSLHINVRGRTDLELLVSFGCMTTAVCGSLVVSFCIRNIRWLFSKPHWMVAHFEPVFIGFIQRLQ